MLGWELAGTTAACRPSIAERTILENSFRPSSRYSSYVLFVLGLAYILNFIDRQVLALVLEDLKTDLGLSDAQLGWLLGPTFAVFYTIAGLPLARLADRWSRTGVLALCLSLWSGMTVLCGSATNFLQMAILRCSVAVGEAGGTPPSHALISDYFSPARRSTALSIYGWGIFLGTAIGFVGGGVIADLFDWRVAFYTAGLLGVPVVLLVVFTIQEPPPGGSEAVDGGESPSVMEVVRHLARTPSFLLMLAAAACQAFLGYTVLGWGVTFLRRSFGASATEAGFQFGLSAGISGAVGITIGGLLADRLSVRDPRWYGWISGVASIAALPFALVFAWAEEIEGAIAAFSIFYLLNNTYVSILWTLAQNLVAPRMRATASATQLSVLNIVGLGGGPLMAGYVSDVLEPTHGPDALRIALSIAGVVGAVAGLFFFWMTRYLREDLAAVSPDQT